MSTVKKMERVIIHSYGDPKVLKSEIIELQPDKNNGLLIEVWAVGVGFADIMAQRGGYALAPKLPFTPGYDFIGRIIDSYDSVNFQNEDMVAALTPKMGTYKDLIEVKEELLVKVPPGSDILNLGAAILNYLTAYCILEEKAKVKQGDIVFIQGVSGGVGIALAQIGKLKGLKMYGTASKEKHGLLKEMGVIAIDYKNEDFVSIIQNDYPKGINAAFDARGGKSLLDSSRIVKKGGFVVSYGFSGKAFGGKPEMLKGLGVLIRLFLTPNGKRVRVCGTPGEVEKKPQWYNTTLKKIFKEISLSKLKPIIASSFLLNDAMKAHELMESGNFIGKIMLKTKYFLE